MVMEKNKNLNVRMSEDMYKLVTEYLNSMDVRSILSKEALKRKELNIKKSNKRK